MLPEILARSTKMKVLQVTEGMKVEKDHFYVITPGTTLTVKNGCLKLVPKGLALKPINDFMICIASERKTQAIGIIMSETGNDGSEGLKPIKAEGDITFALKINTTKYSVDSISLSSSTLKRSSLVESAVIVLVHFFELFCYLFFCLV
jgi:two-component system CheB/CheR fusion protein